MPSDEPIAVSIGKKRKKKQPVIAGPIALVLKNLHFSLDSWDCVDWNRWSVSDLHMSAIDSFV